MKTKTYLLQTLCIILLASCTKNDTLRENVTIKESNPLLNEKSAITKKRNGKTYRTEKYMAEYITDAKSGQIGQTVIYKVVGKKHLESDFVPGDPFRGGRFNITYTIDSEFTNDNGLTYNEVSAAVDRAMATWDAVKCSDLNMTKIPYKGNLGFITAFTGYGGNTEIVADIQHSGFLPASFFDLVAPGGSYFILAVTYTFIWVDEKGIPTDFDNNGLADVAFREIYYNDGFYWKTNFGDGYDIESVALHEAGHGLSQGHFGKAFITNSNGKLHIAPRAVMNPIIWDDQRTLLGTDIGGHCSNWANWPNK
jgi:hypothetical protein